MPRQQTFEGPELEPLLERVGREAGPGARILNAERVRRGGLGGFFAKEHFEVTVEIDDDLRAEPEPATLLDLADAVSDQEAFVPGLSFLDPLPSTEGQSFQSVLHRIAEEAGLVEEPPAPAPVPAPVPAAVTYVPPVPATAAAPAVPAIPAVPVETFACTGLPATLAPVPGSAPVRDRLVQALGALPAPPGRPSGKGAVVAVAGEAKRAAAAALLVADELGVPEDQVVRIARTDKDGLADPAAAAEARRSWRRRAKPTIVVLPAGPGAGDRALIWASALLDALEPSVVWGAVPAEAKPEDVAAWSSALGDLDVLAVDDTSRTVSPAAVLATGIPVGRVDGVTATAERWADLLLDRVAA